MSAPETVVGVFRNAAADEQIMTHWSRLLPAAASLNHVICRCRREA